MSHTWLGHAVPTIERVPGIRHGGLELFSIARNDGLWHTVVCVWQSEPQIEETLTIVSTKDPSILDRETRLFLDQLKPGVPMTSSAPILESISDAELTQRVDDLLDQRQDYQNRIDALGSELHKLKHEQSRRRYNCPCVRHNRDLNIFDMRGQEQAGRSGLGSNMVIDSFSAVKGCPTCEGNGVRKDKT